MMIFILDMANSRTVKTRSIEIIANIVPHDFIKRNITMCNYMLWSFECE